MVNNPKIYIYIRRTITNWLQYNIIQNNTVQHNTTQLQCDTKQCNTIRYDATQQITYSQRMLLYLVICVQPKRS